MGDGKQQTSRNVHQESRKVERKEEERGRERGVERERETETERVAKESGIRKSGGQQGPTDHSRESSANLPKQSDKGDTSQTAMHAGARGAARRAEGKRLCQKERARESEREGEGAGERETREEVEGESESGPCVIWRPYRKS